MTTFDPSADRPPSANTTACTVNTTDTHNTAAHGPTSTAASTPPRRCPLVPPATGKFNICTAKMNAETSPHSGICRSWSVSDAFFRLTPTPAAATTAAPADVGASMNPSGMCTAPPDALHPHAIMSQQAT